MLKSVRLSGRTKSRIVSGERSKDKEPFSLWVAVNETTVSFTQKVGSTRARRPDVANLVF